MIAMSRLRSSVCKLSPVTRNFITFEKRPLLTYMTDVLGAVYDCYIELVLKHGHVYRVETPAEIYETYEELHYC